MPDANRAFFIQGFENITVGYFYKSKIANKKPYKNYSHMLIVNFHECIYSPTGHTLLYLQH